MGIYISGVKGLPEQVQANKEDIKTIQEEIEGIDFEQIRQLEEQVEENTQDINNLEGSIGVQNQAINTLRGDVDDLESKTQKISYDEQSGELTIDTNVNIKRLNITASQTPLRADSMVSRDDKNAISLVGANDEISLIVGRTGNQHVLNFNADGTLDIDGNPIGAKALYQHNITLNGQVAGGIKNYVLINIINDDATPFTLATITSYMQTNYTSSSWFKGLSCTGYIFDTNLILYINYNNGLAVANVNLQNPAAGIQNSLLSGWILNQDNVVQIA